MVHLEASDAKEISFLLGAGAVRDAGLPTAIELQEIAETEINSNLPHALLHAFRFVCGAIQFGKACKGDALLSRVNIEDILVACSFLTDRSRSYAYPFVSAWHELIGQLQALPSELQSGGNRDVFRYLGEYCKSGLKRWLELKEPHRAKYLRNLKDFIDAGYKLRIFTLNFDDCIERALNDTLGSICSRWTTGFNANGWHPEEFASNQYDAWLYKLHGSLDWIDDPKLGICSTKWPAAEDTDELADYDPLIIFGTDAKIQPIDPYLTLLFNFRQALSRCKVLVAVGYSFADTHINAMIREALQRQPQLRCIIAHQDMSPKSLLPQDFDRLVAVEERFVHVPCFAKAAFENNELLTAVRTTIKARDEELPF